MAKLEVMWEVPPSRQQLIFAGAVLSAGSSLGQAGIKGGDTLHVVVKGASGQQQQQQQQVPPPSQQQ